MSDKDDLNLDGNQIRETQSNLTRSNDTVELRLKEAYRWLMVFELAIRKPEAWKDFQAHGKI